MSDKKETNPKDAVGCSKPSLTKFPLNVALEVSLGMTEGGCKYGPYNFRVAGVRSSIYIDATFRHLIAWWNGEDQDADSGLSHITKAISSLVVLRDAQMNNKETDDRPIAMDNPYWMDLIRDKSKEIVSRFPNPKEAFTQIKKDAGEYDL